MGIGEWSRQFHQPRGQHKIVAALSQLLSYHDESGDSKAEKVFVMAGFIGSTTEWIRFERKWAAITKGVEFHAKDFFARDPKGRRCGIYEDWTDSRAEKFINSLGSTLVGSRLELIAVTVDVQAFMALSVYERRYLTMAPFHDVRHYWRASGAPTKPYALAFSWTVQMAVDMRRNKAARVHFWFDRNRTVEGWANDAFRLMRDHQVLADHVSSGMGDLTFGDSAHHPGIQAADLCAYILAWADQKKADPNAIFKSKDFAIAADWLLRFNGSTRMRNIEMNAEVLDAAIREVPEEVRKAWNTDKQRGIKTGKRSRARA